MEGYSVNEFKVIKYIFLHHTVCINQIVNSLGIYPEYAISAVDALISKGHIINKDDVLTLSESGQIQASTYPFADLAKLNIDSVTKQFGAARKNMPDESPTQFQYWFNESTCEKILNLTVNMLAVPSPKIAFIGSPLLALYFQLAFPNWAITVVDVSKTILNYLRPLFNKASTFILADVRVDDVPSNLGCYDAVMIDPPFYADYYSGFLRWSEKMQMNGGLLFSVIFGSAIKDNYAEQKVVMDLIAKKYVFIRAYNDLLEYSVPQFEIQTYKEKYRGLIQISDWRQNTLGVFAKCDADESEIHYVQDAEWVEYVFGKKRIMVKKCDFVEPDSLLFRPLYFDSYIMKSVSRRSEERKNVCIWTTDNEVFVAGRAALEIVHQTLNMLEDGKQVPKQWITDLEREYGMESVRLIVDKISELAIGSNEVNQSIEAMV